MQTWHRSGLPAYRLCVEIMYHGRCVFADIASCFSGMFEVDRALEGTAFVPTTQAAPFTAFTELDIITAHEIEGDKGDFSARLCVVLGHNSREVVHSREIVYRGQQVCLGVSDAHNYEADSYSEDMEIAYPPYVVQFEFRIPSRTLPDEIVDEIEEGIDDPNNDGEPQWGNWDEELNRGIAELAGLRISLHARLDNVQPRVEHTQPGIWRFASFGLMCEPDFRYPGNQHFDYWNASIHQHHLSDAMAHAFLYETIEWGRRDLKGRASGYLLACS